MTQNEHPRCSAAQSFIDQWNTEPQGVLEVILDTDTANEVDDQFALAYALLSSDRISLQAVTAAPFANEVSGNDPKLGMSLSVDEAHRVLRYFPEAQRPSVVPGATQYLPDIHTPVASEAVEAILQLSHRPCERPLVVVGIGAATNLASALLADPSLAERVVMVWLGGHAPYWPHCAEFNLHQDVHAARVLMKSGVALVLTPCYPVASHLLVTTAELDRELGDAGPLSRSLASIVREHLGPRDRCAKEIWDLAAVAWCAHPEYLSGSWTPALELRGEPPVWGEPLQPGHDFYCVRQLDRNALLLDLYAKLVESGV